MTGTDPFILLPVKGFIETSLIDWDGKIASVLFLGGCNLRCPFCQNKGLVLTPGEMDDIQWSNVERFLRRNRDFIDGVVITGGEPLLHDGVEELIVTLRSMGLHIKVDTNGMYPDRVNRLLEEASVDHWAVDVKAPFFGNGYREATGGRGDGDQVLRSIRSIMGSVGSLECRTTLVPGIVPLDSLAEMYDGLAGMGVPRWFIQQFVPHDTLDEAFLEVVPYETADVKELVDELPQDGMLVSMRGFIE